MLINQIDEVRSTDAAMEMDGQLLTEPDSIVEGVFQDAEASEFRFGLINTQIGG